MFDLNIYHIWSVRSSPTFYDEILLDTHLSLEGAIKAVEDIVGIEHYKKIGKINWESPMYGDNQTKIFIEKAMAKP